MSDLDKVDRRNFVLQVGKNLQRIRRSKGLTQAQLAVDSNMEISQISRIERGVLNTSIGVLYEISKALNVSVQDFFEQ